MSEWVRAIAPGTFRRVGDRDQIIFGPVDSVTFPSLEKAQALPGAQPVTAS
jgi:hypothetical protein